MRRKQKGSYWAYVWIAAVMAVVVYPLVQAFRTPEPPLIYPLLESGPAHVQMWVEVYEGDPRQRRSARLVATQRLEGDKDVSDPSGRRGFYPGVP